jgi:hypothetical protein
MLQDFGLLAYFLIWNSYHEDYLHIIRKFTLPMGRIFAVGARFDVGIDIGKSG